MCNVGSAGPRSSRGGQSSSDQSGGRHGIGLHTSSSASALSRAAHAAGMHASSSSSTLHRMAAGNDNNNNTNTKSHYNEADDPNQVTIYR